MTLEEFILEKRNEKDTGEQFCSACVINDVLILQWKEYDDCGDTFVWSDYYQITPEGFVEVEPDYYYSV